MNGDSVLSVKYGNTKKDFFNDLVERSNQRFVLVGGTDYDLSDSTYAHVIEVQPNGAFMIQQQWSYHNMVDAQFTSISVLNDPYHVLVRKQFNSGHNRLQPMLMITLPIFDITGGVTPYGSSEDDELFDSYRTRDKGFISVGYTKGFSGNLTDVFIVKLDSNYNSIAGAPSTVGVNEINQPLIELSVYPTITNDKITIRSSGLKGILYIHDALGKLIETIPYDGAGKEHSLLNYSTGLYFVSFKGDTISKTYKILKTN
jgi:hypothetical protein